MPASSSGSAASSPDARADSSAHARARGSRSMSTTRAAPASAAPIPPRPSPAPRSQTVRPRTSSLRRVRTLDRATALGHGRVQYGSRCVSPLSMYSSMASSMSAGKTSVMAAPASSTGSLWAVRARGLRFPPWRGGRPRSNLRQPGRGGRGVGRAAASGGERVPPRRHPVCAPPPSRLQEAFRASVWGAPAKFWRIAAGSRRIPDRLTTCRGQDRSSAAPRRARSGFSSTPRRPGSRRWPSPR